MNKLLLTSTFVIGLAAGQMANALTINATVGGSAPAGAYYVNFDDGTAGPLGLTLTPDAKMVSGAVVNEYAAPYVSNLNNQYFNSTQTVPGADSTIYLTTGKAAGSYPNAKVVLNFATAQTYLGLLWGSVDNYNTLEFYSELDGTGTLVDSVVGSDPAFSGVTKGNQGINGTAYVNIGGFSDAFKSAVFTSSEYAFEFDNVAYKTSVPDGGTTAALLGLGLTGLGFLARRKV